MLGKIIGELILKWGVKKVLQTIIDLLEKNDGKAEQQLAKKLQLALDEYVKNSKQ